MKLMFYSNMLCVRFGRWTWNFYEIINYKSDLSFCLREFPLFSCAISFATRWKDKAEGGGVAVAGRKSS